MLSHFLRHFRAAWAVVAATTVLSSVFGVSLSAMAADDSDSSPVRWSVVPADQSGPDGRTFVENSLDPGESVEDHFAVRNVSNRVVEFRLAAADGFYSATGRFDVLPSDQESVAAGTWIELPETVVVGANETVVVPFSITVPEQAEPGDHAAGITASVLSTQKSEDGTAVGVESRVGFRVTTRVTGELAPSATVSSISTDYALSWNPIRAGTLTATFEVSNSGNTILLAAGTVDAGGVSVPFPAEGEKAQELLPGDSRSFTVVVTDVWPLFVVPTTVTLTPTMRTMGGEESAVAPIEAQVMTVAIPWPQLVVLLGLALIVFAIMWGRIRSRRKVATLVEQAREQGRLEASERERSL